VSVRTEWDIAIENTDAGNNVPVVPLNAVGGADVSQVGLVFSNVTTRGATTVQFSSPPETPTPPDGYSFQLDNSGNPIYFDIRTTAAYQPWVEIAYHYDPNLDPADLALLHKNAAGGWVDVTELCGSPGARPCPFTNPDTTNHILYGLVDSLSPFALARTTHHFSGFLQPINSDSSSIFKRGNTIPVKFRLTRPDGTYVTGAVARLSVGKLSDTGSVVEQPVAPAGKGNSENLFRYDSDRNQYVYNLSTERYSAGTYFLEVKVNDSVRYAVAVSVR
jgi:hypothetical protein